MATLSLTYFLLHSSPGRKKGIIPFPKDQGGGNWGRCSSGRQFLWCQGEGRACLLFLRGLGGREGSFLVHVALSRGKKVKVTGPWCCPLCINHFSLLTSGVQLETGGNAPIRFWSSPKANRSGMRKPRRSGAATGEAPSLSRSIPLSLTASDLGPCVVKQGWWSDATYFPQWTWETLSSIKGGSWRGQQFRRGPKTLHCNILSGRFLCW